MREVSPLDLPVWTQTGAWLLLHQLVWILAKKAADILHQSAAAFIYSNRHLAILIGRYRLIAKLDVGRIIDNVGRKHSRPRASVWPNCDGTSRISAGKGRSDDVSNEAISSSGTR
ncbi:hypothetical protein BV20DRAFT_518438 [Pilatotrama ljubarskyi]|nr:hypothetical protein BV20DRAFT_518438 [Pilatotrama ljubarskyi]